MALDLDELIWSEYERRKEEVFAFSKEGDVEGVLCGIENLWGFINRFRNCGLTKYVDKEMHDLIRGLNPPKSKRRRSGNLDGSFRMGYVISNVSDTGGAVPHRFLLGPKLEIDNTIVDVYVLVSSGVGISGARNTEGGRRLVQLMGEERVDFADSDQGALGRGKYIEKWLRSGEFDFCVMMDPGVSELYSIASKPVDVIGVLPQDCYSWTMGPGFGDITFLITMDQLFNYAGLDGFNQHRQSLVQLPLHDFDYIDEAQPISKMEIGIPEEAVVSGSSNMWKSFAGDSDILLNGIERLLREHNNYHHLFIGTPRCEEALNYFVNKNPDLQGRVKYIGPVKNIYRLLKTLDFWVNSFPTSGGTDIEAAAVGKPTIEFVAHRRLNLHPTELLRNSECMVTNLEEFLELGGRFIEDKRYRIELGELLKQVVRREFSKQRIVERKICMPLIRRSMEKGSSEREFGDESLQSDIDFEKRIGVFRTCVSVNGSLLRRREWLEGCMRKSPDKPFAWIKMLELFLAAGEPTDWRERVDDMPEILMKDARVLALWALCHRQAGQPDEAGRVAEALMQLPCVDAVSLRVAARILLTAGQADRALSAAKRFMPGVGHESLSGQLEALPPDVPPLFYNY